MITILLILHVLSAVLSLVLAGGVALATYSKKQSVLAVKMWFATLGALVSGTVLVVVSSASVGSSCLPLASLLFVVLMAQLSQKLVLQPQKTKN